MKIKTKAFKRTTSILLILVMTLGIFALAGCGGTDDNNGDDAADGETSGWAYIENNGELVVGLDDTFAPMGFRDENNELVGFDIDLANAVGEQLGVKITFRPIDWDAKEMELESKNVDCLWNGMSATEERQEKMSLTNKYLNNRIVVMSLGSDVNITSAEDLANYSIGTQVDSAALEVMQASDNWDAFAENVNEFPTYDEALMALQGKRVDVIVVDEVLGEYKNAQLGGTLFVCDFDFGDDFYAIGCRKGETDVADKINEAIKALIDNGKAAEISEKWFGKDIVIFEDYE
ncbi:MAG: amino acid ABC transporter substrate-binding protein [Eubacteriales Family XIII. Incertae Sedis bacterium]|nr:MAG: amino acid ABC transporter substrate-binding protein [Clostridiales Family XIII bacterium]PWM68088.1 MAG: amino acid ABC transporter substrate-binding protein [Clostridiales Family XIII bacterium]PWM68241.1 MAG: amino acid ABC transporter substrate-binding protein [Clostridiales Family XIII bacterium]